MISLIVATSKNNCIGKDGKLPWHLPADLEHFKRVTMGKVVVMGRKTFESIGKPLPGRVNVVLSRTLCKARGVQVVRSVEEVLAMDSPELEIMVIGGSEVYRQFVPHASRCYLTQVDVSVQDGDTFWDELPGDWHVTHWKNHPVPPLGYSLLTLEKFEREEGFWDAK